LGAHQNDIAQWAADMDHAGPVSVEARGEAPHIPDGYNTHPDFHITYRYSNGVTLICMSAGENGVLFEGEAGWIFVSWNGIRGGRTPGQTDLRFISEPLPRDAIRLYPSVNHMDNFVECIRTRSRTTCDVEIGHRSATVCHLGNISLRLDGRGLVWNPEVEQFVGDGEANGMLSREMRPPWKLET
jgi:hypothetical protein